MGSSWGISVRFTSSRVSFSSSKATVKMAPGGVQVPTMRWWTGILLVGDAEKGLAMWERRGGRITGRRTRLSIYQRCQVNLVLV